MDSHDVHGKLETLARVGIATKGVVYLIVGGLATWAAFGTGGGEVTGSKGALVFVGEQPFGQLLLWLAAVGLAGYAMWKGAQAIFDADHEGSNVGGLLERFGNGVSGVAHLILAAVAVGLARGFGSGGADDGPFWAAPLMAQPFGVWLVGLVGAIMIVVGINQLRIAWVAAFMKRLHTSQMSPEEQRWTKALGQLGHAARAVVFVIIGGFLILAARQADPDTARGLGGALHALLEQPYGPWLLGIVSLGLVAYGVYTLAEARRRHVEV